MTIVDAQELLGRFDHHEHKEGLIYVTLDEQKKFEYYFGEHGENYELYKNWWYTVKTKEKPLLWMFEQFSKGGSLTAENLAGQLDAIVVQLCVADVISASIFFATGLLSCFILSKYPPKILANTGSRILARKLRPAIFSAVKLPPLLNS